MLEQFEISKMAAKMAAGANRKNNFRTSGLTIACDTPFLGKRIMSNPCLGVFLQFEVNITALDPKGNRWVKGYP